MAVALELALRYTRWGLSIRAVGSNEQSAARIGVRTTWVVGAFVACSLLTVVGGVMVMAQLGIGDPNQGVDYTLASVAAVVLGGAQPLRRPGLLFRRAVRRAPYSGNQFGHDVSRSVPGLAVLVYRICHALRGGDLFPGAAGA